MRILFFRALFLFFFIIFILGVWQYYHHPLQVNDNKDHEIGRQIEDSEEKLLVQVNEEIEAIRDVDDERSLLHLIPLMGLSGAALEERLSHEKSWLDEVKVFIRFHLGLDIRFYLDYLEQKHRLYQQLIKERQMLKKRYGDGADFEKKWNALLPQLLRPYYENLEDLFENNYDEVVKFNQLFNDKLMLNRRKDFKDNPVFIGL